MEQIFIQLAVILLTAFLVSYFVRAFKQPLIIGYIIAGIIISPFIIQFGASESIIQSFSKFGIAFLLFIVGLHLNPRVIKEVGSQALVIGLLQMILTFGIGFAASLFLLNLDATSSAYIGVALSFSSTIIITKLLSDKKQIDSLYGKLSIGILIIQDLVAVGVLMYISSIYGGTSFGSFAFNAIASGSLLILFLFLFGFFVLPKIVRSLAKTQELLFLFSICWCFLVGALFSILGFSIEIGALIAGVVLSIAPYSTEISSKIRPLRDFFLIIFFIILGLNVQVSDFSSIILPAVILSLAVLIFKPVIAMTFMAMFRYTKRTNFFVGTTLGQISEFSLIILALGVSLGQVTGEILSIITLTGLITITISTYMVIYSNEFYEKMSWFASIFEKKGIKQKGKIEKKYNVILFGYNRIGFNILNSVKRIKKSYVVVDFNPDVIDNLTKFKIPCIYGDGSDSDFLEDLPLEKVEMVISTIPDFETNLLLIENVRSVNSNAIIIVRAHQIEDAFKLYKEGASYVLTPHFLGGEYVAKMIREEKFDAHKYYEEKEKHISMLNEIMAKGHDHPEVEKN